MRLARTGLVLVIAAGAVSGCKPSPEPETVETTLCARFSFGAAGRAEMTQARLMFFQAFLKHGKDYADNSIAQQSIYYLGGGRLLLTGYGPINHAVDKSTQELGVAWLHTVTDGPNSRSTPCTFPGEKQAFEAVRAAYAARWRVVDDPDTPRLSNPPRTTLTK
jgi:hypothetical protein